MKMQALYMSMAAMTVASAAVAAQPATSHSTQPTTSTSIHIESDARWSPWLGCWRPEAVDGVAPPAHIVCVLPGTDNGVSIATIADGKILSEQPVTADGVARATNEGGCKGTETAAWSQDGRRVFMKSDLSCGADVHRISNGVLAMISTGSYVDVQTVDVSGQKASRTVRYVAVADADVPSVVAGRLVSEPLVSETARLSASAPLDFADVVEATHAVGSETIDGLLVARRAGFQLDASTLRKLSTEGVEPSTVDVMVALSYPKHFEVAEEVPETDPWSRDNRRPAVGYAPATCYDAFGFASPAYYDYDPYMSRYSRCGYNSFYSPYGYDPYGWGYGRGSVIVLGPGEKQDNVKGELVKGKGYTRRGEASGTARPREATPSTSTPRTSSSGTATVRSTGSSSSGSGSSGSSSAGTTTRTAKPRSGGGGGH